MATIKSFTSLEQSKKLAEFLPLESADAYYGNFSPKGLGYEYSYSIGLTPYIKEVEVYEEIKKEYNISDYNGIIAWKVIPAWSLAALLNVLTFPQLSKDKLGSGKEGWMVSVYPNDCRYDSCWRDNPIDACYEMILKLYELNLL